MPAFRYLVSSVFKYCAGDSHMLQYSIIVVCTTGQPWVSTRPDSS